MRLVFVVQNLGELLGDLGDQIEKIQWKLHHDVIEIDWDLINESYLLVSVVDHQHGVEYPLRVLQSCELLELMRSDDDRIGQGVRKGLVDLQEPQFELVSGLQVGLLQNDDQPLQSDHHGFVGSGNNLRILVDGDDDFG